MTRKAWAVPALLLFLTMLPIVMAGVRLAELPRGALPQDSAHLGDTPLLTAAHAIGGMLMGLLGPLQFWGAFRRRFGRAHRMTGRLFVLGGLLLAGSGVALVAAHPDTASPLVDGARLTFSLGLAGALFAALALILNGQVEAHRDWMIRAYALAMGTAPIAFVFLPIYALTGVPPTGLTADLILIGTWLACIGAAEAVIRLALPRRATGALAA